MDRLAEPFIIQDSIFYQPSHYYYKSDRIYSSNFEVQRVCVYPAGHVYHIGCFDILIQT
jgi:hypothetical protein